MRELLERSSLRAIVRLGDPFLRGRSLLRKRWQEIFCRLDGEIRTLRIESRERETVHANYRAAAELRATLAARC